MGIFPFKADLPNTKKEKAKDPHKTSPCPLQDQRQGHNDMAHNHHGEIGWRVIGPVVVELQAADAANIPHFQITPKQ